MGLETLAFVLLGGLALVSALVMITVRSPIHATLSLLGCMLGVAGVFALMSAPYLALAQVVLGLSSIVILLGYTLMQLDLEQLLKKGGRWTVTNLIGATAASVVVITLILSAHGLGGVGEVGEGFGSFGALWDLTSQNWVLWFEVALMLTMTVVMCVLATRKSRV